jgi:hypothetical protein
MEDTTLKKYFDDFTEKIEGLKEDFKKVDDWQRSQYKKVIILREHQKVMEKDIENHKKNVRWGIGVIMPTITAVLLFIANFFTNKTG